MTLKLDTVDILILTREA